jgi:hypothetical protein
MEIDGIKYYDVKEVAAILNLNEQTVRNLGKRGTLKRFKHPITGKVFFRQEDIDKMFMHWKKSVNENPEFMSDNLW